MPVSPSELDVSVVVCTRNRSGPLAHLLGSMESMTPPADATWEILIVDNGSTDDTPAVVESFAGRLPIRRVHEPKAGLSNARNRGVAEARGRYLCWTDDDAEVHPDWLAAYVEAFRAHPDAAVFGGRVTPRLEGPTPPWFAKLSKRWPLNGIVAERDFGPKGLPLDFETGVVPWGVNYAIRAQEQRGRRYDPDLGVSPSHRRSSEESQLLFEVISAGATGWWVPGSQVFHIFPPHRQTRRYVFEHFAAIGEALAHLDLTHETHVMNRDGRQPRLVIGSHARLAWLIGFNAVLYAGFHATGWTQRSLYYLRKWGLYSGVKAYRATLSTGTQRPAAP